MIKPVSDFGGIQAKLSAMGYKEDSKVSKALLSALITLDNFDLSKGEMSIVLALLNKDALKTITESGSLVNAEWEDFNYGNVKIGDFIRVKDDAYDSDTGRMHNGLVGTLLGMRGGKCTVDYLGNAINNSMQHPMGNLQSLKK